MENKNQGILTVVSLSVLLASLGTSIVNIALPSFITYFSASFQYVQWTVIAYLIAITVFVTVAGKLVDQYGHRRVLLSGITLFTLSSFSSAFAKDILLLIMLRGVQGIGAAVLSTVSMVMVRNSMNKVKMGFAMGMLGTSSAIGTAMGPSVGGVLLANFGWPAIFFFLATLGLSVLLLAMRFVKNKDRMNKQGSPINFMALVLLLLSTGTYALAMTISKDRFTINTLVLIILSVILAWCFFQIQQRSSQFLIDTTALKNKTLISSLFANFIVATVMMTTLIVGPFFLSAGLRFNELTVGLTMTAGPVISILTGIPSGKIVDKSGAKLTMRASMLLMLTGTIALAFLPANWGWTGYVFGILLLTPGYQLFQAANNTSVMTAIGEKQSGIVSGVLNLFRNAGLITGASLMGGVFSMTTKNAPGSINKTDRIFFGMEITFLTASLFILLILVKAFLKKR
ncbi:MFS family permease [Mucilaginibacter sp. SG538B]|uniref:MFS transporter n=1 Tax=Mucilaginibacter sp. SG538B TaxID=2587021 RepID=UPI00159D40CD|nr:MFS transporter [Mucilaginibacter sp. SG538B]NVM66584.1 MFS family permease [Mucilaginibacter sp. SG538B]